MPERSRSRLVLGMAVLAALVLAVAGAAAMGGRSGRGTAAGSSFRADESGLLGARRILQTLGYRVESRRSARLPVGTGHVLIRVEGLPGAEPDETPEWELLAAGRDLDAWVSRGNSALVVGASSPRGTSWPSIVGRDGVAQPAAPDPDVSRFFQDLKQRDPADALATLYGKSRPKVSDADGADVDEKVTLLGPGDPWISERYAVSAPPEAEVLATAPSPGHQPAPVVVETRRGDGRVVMVADPVFLSNVRLASSDNAAWLAVLVARLAGRAPAETSVWFDDRAVGQAASRGVLSLFSEAGLGSAFGAGMLLVLLWWWRAGPSDAPERHLRDAPSFRPETFALLRADLYAECLTTADARRMVEDEVARRLGRGDSGGCDRALAMLSKRDPQRAARIREALDELPKSAAVTPRRHPEEWADRVSRLWAALASQGAKGR